MSSPLCKASRGFTLVEVLVVAAILAVLISLLSSVFAKAMRSADSSACISNLRQIGIAINLYAAEHGMRYPGVGITATSARRWNLLLNDYFFQGKTTIAQSKFEKSSLFCPAYGKMPEDFGSDSPTYARTYAINIMTFVGWTDKIIADRGYVEVDAPPGYQRLILGEALAKFDRKASTVLVGEVEFPTDVMQAHDNINPIPEDALSNGYLYKGGRQAYRHNERMNVLFMDGHVAPMGLADGMDLRKTFGVDQF